jgi:acyl-coenzyme A thioesterase PaaI-like protein
MQATAPTLPTGRTLTPCAAALGLAQPKAGDGRATALLPAAPRIALADGRVHPLALLPFLDELASHAVLSLGIGQDGMATMELRLDFLGQAAPGAILGSAEALGGLGGARLARADARDRDGRLVAAGQLWFQTGSFPGQPGGLASPVLSPTPARDWGDGPFERLIGLVRKDGAARLTPADAAVGWTGLPAVHGGIVAALLAAATQEALLQPERALASISVRYLRAVLATGAAARASPGKVGRRSAHLRATCMVADGGPVLAEAEALFLS